MKAKILVLLFLSLTMSISLWGYDFVYNGIYYNILSGNTSVEVTYRNTNYNSYSGSVSYRFVKWSDENDYNPRIFVARNDLTLAAYLFFSEAPQNKYPTCMVKAVSFFGNSIGGMNYRNSNWKR